MILIFAEMVAVLAGVSESLACTRQANAPLGGRCAGNGASSGAEGQSRGEVT